MGQVAGVLDDPPGFPYTPPGIDVFKVMPAVLFPNQAVMQPVSMLSTVQE